MFSIAKHIENALGQGEIRQIAREQMELTHNGDDYSRALSEILLVETIELHSGIDFLTDTLVGMVRKNRGLLNDNKIVLRNLAGLSASMGYRCINCHNGLKRTGEIVQ